MGGVVVAKSPIASARTGRRRWPTMSKGLTPAGVTLLGNLPGGFRPCPGSDDGLWGITHHLWCGNPAHAILTLHADRGCRSSGAHRPSRL